MVILIQCKDRVGLVADIAGVIAKLGINIVAMKEHVDTLENRFFVRIVVDGVLEAMPIWTDLKAILPEGAEIAVNPSTQKKVIVLVTKEYHCLGDILIRNHFKTLGAEVQCVIGNHPTLQDVCKRFDIPFHFVPHENKEKDVFESEVVTVIEKYKTDYLVLAKYMRILSPSFVEKFAHRIINIHHSFLPAFIGASPYRQAFERGVKLIGATAHFVTNDLDEGPIIAQQIIPVNHSFTASDMVRSGKEIETAVLAKALQLVFEERVLIWKNKTVIFE
ncbi:MAG TPA: formyltetrahydrofolate deformylase [Ferruginibacter sp.]|nr:formyltetrahydrofolate deformylase [Ferruginibacter sp.]HPH92932.1 formyltetrahydrofolate deformylase [Ferruginibacter sp.]